MCQIWLHYVILFSYSWFLWALIAVNRLTSLGEHEIDNDHFDYIIVGGGSAGAILASRLSEDPNLSVLLIEAGVSKPSLLDIPALGPLSQLSDLDWQYTTIPQKHSCFGLKNNVSKWPAGRVLGGSTHLNYMIHFKGYRNDFLSWKSQDSNDWNYDEILHYFNKAEANVENDRRTGLQLVRNISYTTPLSNAVLEAALELGYSQLDMSSDPQIGFIKPLLNMDMFGQRWTADRNVKQFMKTRRNLKVITNAVAQKILMHGDYEANGVEYEKGGRITKQFAKQEVILSAGTIGSAKLLMLSGIGPDSVLSKALIHTKVDLPVGKHLQDHITTGLDLIILNRTVFSLNELISPVSALEYFLLGRGPYTSAMCEAVGFFHSQGTVKDKTQPDLQFMVMMAGLSSDGGLFSRKALGLSSQLWDEYYSLVTNESVVTILPVLLHPKSSGDVQLNPSDAKGPAVIDPRYLSREEDVKVLIKGIRFIQKILKCEAMQELGARFNTHKLPGCHQFEFDSDEYWECYVRHVTLTSYHPIGTCKMGAEDDSVVDHKLRVHKTNKLRVIDASVMPNLISGNINAAVVMIAEKGADLIKEAYFHRLATCGYQDVFVESKMCSLLLSHNRESFLKNVGS